MGVRWYATATEFTKSLHDLLPNGRAWSREPGRRHSRLLAGIADELVRVQNRAGALIEEADPRTTSNLLPDWERVTGLPEFGYIPPDVPARRSTLAGKLAAQGGQNAAYFETIIEAMGITDAVVSRNPIKFLWTVDLPTNIRRARIGDHIGDLLMTFDETAIRVRLQLEKYKPAHSWIYWTGDVPRG